MQTITLPTSPLSGQQLRVVELLADGLSDEAIAAEMRIGVRTVRRHMDEAKSKMLAVNRVQLAVQAIRHNVIT
jgi:DNA-binding NarL/FixJ family response regulator